MLSKAEIDARLRELDEELARRGIKGELCLFGGAAMCLAFDARPATRDVDAIFAPSSVIREAAAQIAARHDIDADWLNDSVKDFVVLHERRILLDLPNLKVFVPHADYLLAMKALAARTDATDRQDVEFLARKLGLTSADEVFGILRRFHPNEQVKPATRFFIEEVFDR